MAGRNKFERFGLNRALKEVFPFVSAGGPWFPRLENDDLLDAAGERIERLCFLFTNAEMFEGEVELNKCIFQSGVKGGGMNVLVILVNGKWLYTVGVHQHV